jgi:hypothetical protein
MDAAGTGTAGAVSTVAGSAVFSIVGSSGCVSAAGAFFDVRFAAAAFFATGLAAFVAAVLVGFVAAVLVEAVLRLGAAAFRFAGFFAGAGSSWSKDGSVDSDIMIRKGSDAGNCGGAGVGRECRRLAGNRVVDAFGCVEKTIVARPARGFRWAD